MAKILTVDDSKAIRTIVSKQIAELGHEVDEAEDGVAGLAKVEAAQYDLVVLDVTMPNLDGPGMLAAMREKAIITPVLMLTSESKRSIMVEVMKSGIEDYILKPFKPEELKAKVQKVMAKLGKDASAAPSGPKEHLDLLVIDDMENVHKKLRTLLPVHLKALSVMTAAEALAACKSKVFRAILVDVDLPDVAPAALVTQLKALQQDAVLAALAVRTANPAHKEMQALGYGEVLFKPFDQEGVDDFLFRHFQDVGLVVAADNLITVGGFSGKEDKLDKYFARVNKLLEEEIDKLAAACHEQAIIDLTSSPVKPDRTPRLVVDAQKLIEKRGMTLKLVARPEHASLLKTFDETAKLKVAGSVDEAKAA